MDDPRADYEAPGATQPPADRVRRENLPGASRDWRTAGIDSEGADLHRDGGFLRLDFDNTVVDPANAQSELAGLAKRDRRLDSPGTGP